MGKMTTSLDFFTKTLQFSVVSILMCILGGLGWAEERQTMPHNGVS